METKATKYLIVESTMSGLINGILNLAAAYAIFHKHNHIPATGASSLLRDTIGETFLVVFLSMMVSSLISRHRRRVGTLPVTKGSRSAQAGNLYIRALTVGLIFTFIGVSCWALLLPRIFPNGVSFGNVVLFKTVYGAVLGSIATFLAVHKAIHEVD